MKKISRPTFYLIAVSLAALAVWFFEKPTEEKKGDRLDRPFFSNFDSASVAAIEIEHLLNGVRLKKENGEWKVGEIKTKIKENLEKEDQRQETRDKRQEKWFVADGNKIDLSLNTLLDLNAVSLAGNNPEKHGFFEVNAAGMQIRLYNAGGKKIEHIYVGKTGAGFLESYIRKDGENEVYLTNRYLRSSFSPMVEDWLKHTDSK